jgi:hypothetical protein
MILGTGMIDINERMVVNGMIMLDIWDHEKSHG